MQSIDPRELLRRDRIELKRDRVELQHCVALLAEAIAYADRWYARRQAGLDTFDRGAKHDVDRLRADGRVQASMVWDLATPI